MSYPSPCYPTAAAASNTAKAVERMVPAQKKKSSDKKKMGAMGERGTWGNGMPMVWEAPGNFRSAELRAVSWD